jgi:hypothetical protein
VRVTNAYWPNPTVAKPGKQIKVVDTFEDHLEWRMEEQKSTSRILWSKEISIRKRLLITTGK